MPYINNETQEIVNAYAIEQVIELEGHYAISIPDARKSVGLFPEQTASYIPQISDFYIDKGNIVDSYIVDHATFASNYTGA